MIDITAITEQFGLLFWRPNPQAPAGISHNLRTVVIDANGRVQKIFTENTWEVDDLVQEMVKAARIDAADIHRRPLAHWLETLEDFNVAGSISALCRCAHNVKS